MAIRILKILVSISLISILLLGVDWRDIAGRLHGLDPLLAVMAFVLLSIQYPISAVKWRKALRLHGVDQPYLRLLRILCIAFFFNNFLPTAIGGDAYRAYRTFEFSARPAHAISAVVVERLFGIAALLFLGYLSAIYLVLFGDLVHRHLIALLVVGATIGTLAVWIAWKLDLPIARRAWTKVSGMHRLEPLFDSLRTIKRNKQHLAGLAGLSLLFQATAVTAITFMFASIGLHGALPESGFTAAAAGIAGVIPISINGVGVVEGSFVVAALEASLPYSEAVLVAICLRIYMVLSSVVFGILYAVEPKEPPVIREDRIA